MAAHSRNADADGHAQAHGKLFLVLEFCDAGDLAGYLLRAKGPVSEATAQHMMRHIAAALRVLRRFNVVHRDLKPSNLLLCGGGEVDLPTLKVADFGFARALATDVALADTLCGSPLYMSPEVLSYKSYDAKVDLWSVGCILFELLTGATPFTGANHVELLRNIERVPGAELPHDAKVSDACRALVRGLLRRAPVERMSYEELFNHPFLLDSGARMSSGVELTDQPVSSSDSPLSSGTAVTTTEVLAAHHSRRVVPADDDGAVDDSGFVLVQSPATPSTMGAMTHRGRPPPSPSAGARSPRQGHSPKAGGLLARGLLTQPALTSSPRAMLLPSAPPPSAPLLPQQHVARANNLQRCAGVLDQLACERAADASPCEALSLYLLALQCVRGAAASLPACAGLPGTPDGTRLARGGDAILTRACALGQKLKADLPADAINSIIVPDAWPLTHAAAAALGCRGAGAELLGRWHDAERCYSRALCLFHLMLHDGNSLQPSAATPPLLLNAAARSRLEATVAALGRRQKVCLAARELPAPGAG